MCALLLRPWRKAFRAQRALPDWVVGPVERRHGAQLRMSAAWRARRSGVHPALVRRELRGDKSLGRRLVRALVGFASTPRKPLVALSASRLQLSGRANFLCKIQVVAGARDLWESPETARAPPVSTDARANLDGACISMLL